MTIIVKSPEGGSTFTNIERIHQGGTGETTAPEALRALGGYRDIHIDQPMGPISIDGDGHPDTKIFSRMRLDGQPVDGPLFIRTNQTVDLYLTAYDSFQGYQLDSYLGALSRRENVLTFQAGTNSGLGRIEINNRSLPIRILPAAPVTIGPITPPSEPPLASDPNAGGGGGSTGPTPATVIAKPMIVSPVYGTVVDYAGFTAIYSNYSVNNLSDKHANTDWQLSTDPNFGSFVSQTLNSTQYKLSLPLTNLTPWSPDINQPVYYLRVMYRGISGATSVWGETLLFKTKRIPTVIETPSITAPVNGGQPNYLTAYTVTASTYVANWTDDVHAMTDWEISTNATFTSLVFSSYSNTTNKTSIGISNTVFQPATTYYLRVRYRCTTGNWSNWSATSSCTTAPRPTASIWLDTSSVVVGNGTTLRWSTTGASSVSITNIGSVAASGSVWISPGSTTTYQISATNAVETIRASCSLTVFQDMDITISGTNVNIDLYTLAVVNGFVPGRRVNITVAGGAVVGSTSTGSYAMTTGSFPSGTQLKLTNNGYIVGKGGDGSTSLHGPVQSWQSVGAGENGGHALYVTIAMTIYNYGVIGGGGGGGQGAAAEQYYGVSGGGGGGGAGYYGGNGGGSQDGTGLPGDTGSVTNGGAGGKNDYHYGTYWGGRGGNLGEQGQPASGGINNPGNATPRWSNPGYAVVGNSNVSWGYSGDIRGSLG